MRRWPWTIVAVSLLLAALGPSLAPSDPERPTPHTLLPPSFSHPMGTDGSGIDVLSIVLAAFRVDVLIAVAAVGIALVVGILIGCIAGYSFNGNRAASVASAVSLRILDFVQTIPVFVLGLALVGMLGAGVRNLVIAVAFVNFPLFARLTRTAIRGTEAREFIAASRALGLRESGILRRHVLPNSLDATVASASVGVGSAVLLTAGLSFVGAGVRPPTPELGGEIARGANYVVTGQWWIGVLPGIVLSVVVLGFAVAGDSLRIVLGSARRRRGTSSSVGVREAGLQ